MEQAGNILSRQQRDAVVDTLTLTSDATGLALRAIDLGADGLRPSNVSPTRQQEGLAREALCVAADTLDSVADALKALNESLNPEPTS